MPQQNFLAQCLVEGGAGKVTLECKRRRKALGLSLLVQVALLCVPLFSPLFAAPERLASLTLTPLPPYRGYPSADRPAHPNHPAATTHRPQISRNDTLFQPPVIPPRIDTSEDPAQAENACEAVSCSDIPGAPDGLLPPIGNGGQQVLPLKPPPEPSAAVRLIKVIEPVQQAKLVHRVEPIYPPIAKQIHLQGTVIIRALISREGTIRSLQVLSGHPILAKAASEAIGEWRYQPTLLNGTAVEVETLVTVIFILH